MARKRIGKGKPFVTYLRHDLADWVEEEAIRRNWSLSNVIRYGVMLLKTTLEQRTQKKEK